MKGKPKDVKKYSMEDLESLINSIKTGLSLTEEAISTRAGYNEGYISQTISRGVVPSKLIENINREFRWELHNAKISREISQNNAMAQATEPGFQYKDFKDKYIGLLEKEVLHHSTESKRFEAMQVILKAILENQILLRSKIEKRTKDSVRLEVNRLLDELLPSGP